MAYSQLPAGWLSLSFLGEVPMMQPPPNTSPSWIPTLARDAETNKAKVKVGGGSLCNHKRHKRPAA